MSRLTTSRSGATFLLALQTALLILVPGVTCAQTTESGSPNLSSPDQVMIRKDMEKILQRPEFRHLTRERQITQDSDFDLDDFIKPAPAPPSYNSTMISDIAGSIIMMLSYLSIICACGLILFLLYRAIVGFKLSRKLNNDSDTSQLQGEIALEETVSPAELAASTYQDRAHALAKSGDFHHAIIQLLYGSMSFIERSGWIRFRKGLTYRDYLRAARPHGLPGESLRQMIRTYEPLGFGRRVATREHFESTLQHYEAAFQKKA